MKELTIEEKARRYDEAIQRARNIVNSINVRLIGKDSFEAVFPELKESEGEKIRGKIIATIHLYYGEPLEDEAKEMIAWLEKQGEQKPILDVEIPFGAKDSDLEEVSYNIPNGYHAEIEDNKVVIKQGEQKPTDKAEPKFKVGDWICHTVYKKPLLIVEDLGEGDFRTEPKSIITAKEFREGVFWLWTIQDAKDGDVLYTSSTASNEVFVFKELTIEGYIKCYCSYDSEDKYCEGKYHFIGKPTFMTHPATKEQRDLLFQKMKEAGYEWDAERKELKKIELRQEELTDFEKAVKHITEEAIECGDTHNFKADADMLLRLAQKNAEWSEEDEAGLSDAIWAIEQARTIAKDENDMGNLWYAEHFLKSLKNRVKPHKQEWSDEDEETLDYIIAYIEKNKNKDTIYTKRTEILEGMVDWLKSLKEKYTWKPNDEQMEALLYEVNAWDENSVNGQNLKSLYQDLKKLREK